MNSAGKGWYWLAAGVLALGLNGYYQDGGMRWLHDFAQRGTATAAQARGEAVTFAELAVARHLRWDHPVRAVVALDDAAVPADVQVRVAGLHERLGDLQGPGMQAQPARLRQFVKEREMGQVQADLWKSRIAVLSDQDQIRVVLPQIPRVEVSVPHPDSGSVAEQPN